MSDVATTAGITGEDVRDLMVAAVEHRFGPVNQLLSLIEWMTDNRSCYVARDTRRFAHDIGLVPLESPQSNGMAEAFVRTLKRDHVRVSMLPDAESVLRQPPVRLAHYNNLHPHRARLPLAARVHHPINPENPVRSLRTTIRSTRPRLIAIIISATMSCVCSCWMRSTAMIAASATCAAARPYKFLSAKPGRDSLNASGSILHNEP
ncbi:transposase InsO family protein [Methylorubrum thiocyanatum]|uniref:Transposase InsO family protein n=1 Tax=Methylorubrum thiocyanatum TaxID=47958 RepID=A0AA40S811_9HYPH|nr:transposase InsO family protein [Methylorubrum thiocyanatum]